MSRLNVQLKWTPSDIADMESAAWSVLRSQTHMAVIAGPGAGKTELLAQRASYLLQTGLIHPTKRILAISYKRDAATNLKRRVDQRCSARHAVRFDSYTFDAFAKGLLDRLYPALPHAWRPSPDYDILLPDYRTIPNFLDSLRHRSNSRYSAGDIYGIFDRTFEKLHITGTPLDPDNFECHDVGSWAAAKWWKDCLQGGSKSQLTFPMIGRLAELLIRVNPKVQHALRATYAYVFLDEFQDTTHVQYDLIKSAFVSSSSILTAVGDNKQQIMRWAMALDDPFGSFERDFGATRRTLTRNYRSSAELVRIQHHIALAVDGRSKLSQSRVSESSAGSSCAILEFETIAEEAEYLGKLISSDFSKRRLSPRDFAILVRQKSPFYTSQLQHVLASYGVHVRDESTIQDILAERVVPLLTNCLRLGSIPRGGQYWIECMQAVGRLRFPDPTDSMQDRILKEELRNLHVLLHERMITVPGSESQLSDLIEIILDFLDRDQIKILYPEYSQGDWFSQVVDAAVENLFASCQTCGDWTSALDDFQGVRSVPVMTIHKSKGLEYHTVIFLALDDDAWWSFRGEPEEGRSTFFVAFSRAKHRVFFTYCRERGSRATISPLYDILRDAGVPTMSA